MKQRFFILLFLVFKCFGSLQAQSFLVLENGTVLTTDIHGHAYDLGHFSYPQKIGLHGGLYFVENHNVLCTVDSRGFLYKRYEKVPENILGKGQNYFLTTDGRLLSIDQDGLVHIFKEDLFKLTKAFGGTFFIAVKNLEPHSSDEADATDEAEVSEYHGEQTHWYIVNSEGQPVLVDDFALSLKDIAHVGGNYLMTKSGQIIGISKSAQAYWDRSFQVGIIQLLGGNFFVDYTGLLFTVTSEGELRLPDLPEGLDIRSIKQVGSHFFIDTDGALYVVADDGNIFKRELRDYDLKNISILGK